MKNIFLKKIIRNKKTYYVIGFLLIALMLLNSVNFNFQGKNKLLAPFTSMIKKIDSGQEWAKNALYLNKKNPEQGEIERLRKENEELKASLSENMVVKSDLDELRALKEDLNYISSHSQEHFISTSIIYKNDGNFFTTFVIDAGSESGIKKDSIVIGQNSLVGVIYEVNKNYSKGISLLDSQVSMSFEAFRDKEITGIASQNIAINVNSDFNGYLKGYLFDKEKSVFAGDVLITSVLGMYPGGIQIGEVEEVIEDKGNLLRYIKIRPYVNFKTISKVIVINPREME